jgi:Spy/CpxP family protein refolding chaperone
LSVIFIHPFIPAASESVRGLRDFGKVVQRLVNTSFDAQQSARNIVHTCRESSLPIVFRIAARQGDFMLMKRCLLVFTAASALAMAAPLAGAQDSQTQGSPNNENPAAEQSAPTPGNGGPHHGPMDPAQRTAELTKHLHLTADQQAKVKSTLESARSEMESLRGGSMSQPDRHAKMMEIRSNTNAQIRAVLDPEQQKKFDRMQARQEERMENRRGGPPPQGAAPPQQQ